jgi:hypothetical protein
MTSLARAKLWSWRFSSANLLKLYWGKLAQNGDASRFYFWDSRFNSLWSINYPNWGFTRFSSAPFPPRKMPWGNVKLMPLPFPSIYLPVHYSLSSNHSTLYTYRVAKKSVNLKHFLILTGMFKFKPASQIVERYHSNVSCALNMVDFISNIFCKFSEK